MTRRIPSPGIVPPYLNPSPVPGASMSTPFDRHSEPRGIRRASYWEQNTDGYDSTIGDNSDSIDTQTEQLRRKLSIERSQKEVRGE